MARRHNTKETKEIILSSAVENFIEKGYSKTTLEDIVRKVGLTRGAFYWNYQSKSELLYEIEELYEKFYLDIYAGGYEKCDSAYDTLRNLLIYDLKKKNRPNPYVTIIRYKVEASEELSDLKERQKRMDEKFLGILSAEIRRGQEQGVFQGNEDAESLAILVYMFLLGFDTFNTAYFREDAEQFWDEALIESSVDRILKFLT